LASSRHQKKKREGGKERDGKDDEKHVSDMLGREATILVGSGGGRRKRFTQKDEYNALEESGGTHQGKRARIWTYYKGGKGRRAK